MKSKDLIEFPEGLERTRSSDLAMFQSKNSLTNAQMCAIFGISTQAKYNMIVKAHMKPGLKEEQRQALKNADIDMTFALLHRAYERDESLIPIAHTLRVKDAYEMFQGVYGARYITRSTFGQLMGRSGGSGYRWIEHGGKLTPQIERVLNRFLAMKNLGWTDVEICHFWVQICREEYEARRAVFPFDRIDSKQARVTKEDIRLIEEAKRLALQFGNEVRAKYYGTKKWDTYFIDRARRMKRKAEQAA